MDAILRADIWTRMQVTAALAAMGLLGAIIFGIF